MYYGAPEKVKRTKPVASGSKKEESTKPAKRRKTSKFAHLTTLEDIREDDRRIAKLKRMREKEIQKDGSAPISLQAKKRNRARMPLKLGPILARRFKKRRIDPPD